MGLRFSEAGPDFPDELVDELLAGEVVFFCGAGVSAPQLPGFHRLVTQIYEDNSLDVDPAEQQSINNERYEEALGTLARRLADPKVVYDSAADILRVPERVDLSNHRTLLRLSRSLDNRVALVTTNFDTLFERAIEELDGPDRAREQSHAGQSLPPPGSEDFEGVIHLHGRLEDKPLGLERTPLVLTSAEYGDAYMRSGWAARFLFDLARCRTLVLIGYRVGDAPVRYFLNVLESDRGRFSDLRPVYAFHPFDDDVDTVEHAWASLAVRPLSYHNPPDQADHSTLWRDLDQLAELAERPRATRHRRLREVLQNPLAAASPSDLDAIEWIVRGRRDAWNIVLDQVADPAWFDFFIQKKLWSENDAIWVLSNWCRRNWTDQKRLYAAVRWLKNFRSRLARELEILLNHQPPPLPVWERIWRLLAQGYSRPDRDFIDRAYSIRRLIQRGVVTDRDLQRAVGLLTPTLAVEERWGAEQERVIAEPQRLDDIAHRRLRVSDKGELGDLVQALIGDQDLAERLLQIGTEALRSTAQLAREAELVVGDYDSSDYDVPSVEDHPQNEHHDGLIYIARLLADLLPTVAERNPDMARSCVRSWRDIPIRVARRLWLHAMRRQDLFSSDDAAEAVLSLSHTDFWMIRREVVVLVTERLGDADAGLLHVLVDRIVREGPDLYNDRDEPEDGQTDWRPYARDQAMWLLLSALAQAGCLTEDGIETLNAIRQHHTHLDRGLSERDLFGSWSSGVRRVTGDPAPLQEADAADRLQIAHQLTESRDFDHQDSWRAYCNSDPEGAFEALTVKGLNIADAPLWEQLIGALSSPLDQGDPRVDERQRQLERLFQLMNAQDDAFVALVAERLTDAFIAARKLRARVARYWWDRLWRLVEADHEQSQWSDSDDFYTTVINRSAGALAEALIDAIDRDRKDRQRVSRSNIDRLRRLFRSNTNAGVLARGAIAPNAGFAWTVYSHGFERYFLPRLTRHDDEGIVLRAVMLEYAQLGAGATRALKQAIFMGVEECRATSTAAANVASRILFPVLSEILTDGRVDWNIARIEVRRLLRSAGDNIREGAAECLRTWVKQLEGGPAETWRRGIGPLFQAVWPLDRKYLSKALTADLAATCVYAEDAFPEAFDMIKPYLIPLKGDWTDIYFIEESDVANRFPAKTLDLLWVICGPGSKGPPEKLSEVLDHIEAADPRLTADRRWQWLDQFAIRRG